jgi:hypothetical protein
VLCEPSIVRGPGTDWRECAACVCRRCGFNARRKGLAVFERGSVGGLGYGLVVLAWGLVRSRLAFTSGQARAVTLAPHRSRHGSEPFRMEGRHRRCHASIDGGPSGDCKENRELLPAGAVIVLTAYRNGHLCAPAVRLVTVIVP